jgi:hypothetical protein
MYYLKNNTHQLGLPNAKQQRNIYLTRPVLVFPRPIPGIKGFSSMLAAGSAEKNLAVANDGADLAVPLRARALVVRRRREDIIVSGLSERGARVRTEERK